MDQQLEKINQAIEDSIAVKKSFSDELRGNIMSVADLIVESLKNNGRVYTMGNGGSAADAQHISSELVGRFLKDRRGYAAQAFTTDPSILTSVSNDYTFDDIFKRQVEAHVREGDVIIAISTSGNSKNILNSLPAAKELGAKIIALTGESGGEMKSHCDVLLNVPSSFTPRIQEAHILIYHLICELIEDALS